MLRWRRRWANWRAETRGAGRPVLGALGPPGFPDGLGGTGLACEGGCVASAGWPAAVPLAGAADRPEPAAGRGGTLPLLELCLVVAIFAFLT
jgi:hypothetical protein